MDSQRKIVMGLIGEKMQEELILPGFLKFIAFGFKPKKGGDAIEEDDVSRPVSDVDDFGGLERA